MLLLNLTQLMFEGNDFLRHGFSLSECKLSGIECRLRAIALVATRLASCSRDKALSNKGFIRSACLAMSSRAVCVAMFPCCSFRRDNSACNSSNRVNSAKSCCALSRCFNAAKCAATLCSFAAVAAANSGSMRLNSAASSSSDVNATVCKIPARRALLFH